MPAKNLTTPFDRDGVTQRAYTFGGGADTITVNNGALPDDDPLFEPYSIGYHISGGGGDDTIFGSGIGAPGSGIGDTLIGGDGSDTISGGFGDDTIYGGNEDGSDGGKGKDPIVTNSLFGEERFIFLTGSTVTGGDDTLIAGNDVDNFMFGDAQSINGPGTFTGGDDTLIGGTGNDTMVGDWSSVGGTPTLTGGDDTFVIAANNGADQIIDFELAEFDEFDVLIDAHDVIDLTAFGEGLTFDTLNWTDGNTIEFSAGNTLSFGGGLVTADFHEEDFIFAVA
jgi:Ca2+-binding RTX toxin-like protein